VAQSKKQASEDSLVIRYRVTKDEYQRLAAQAKKYEMSPHVYARRVAFDAIDNAERGRILSELELMQQRMAELSSRVQVINEFALELDSEVQNLKGKAAVSAGKR
jgi:hypothetical protein